MPNSARQQRPHWLVLICIAVLLLVCTILVLGTCHWWLLSDNQPSFDREHERRRLQTSGCVAPRHRVWSGDSQTGTLSTPRVHLLSYADGGAVHLANQVVLANSSRGMGIDVVHSWQREHLDDAEWCARHRDTLSQSRGAGYWLWKPWIVHRLLNDSKLVHENDIVVYADSGASVRNHLQPLIDLAKQHDLVLFDNWHTNMSYFKREALRALGVMTEAEERMWLARTQLDAAFLVMKNTPATREFVRTWLEHCSDSRKLTDARTGEVPEFAWNNDHRHDQSLLSYVADTTPHIPKFRYPRQGVTNGNNTLLGISEHFFDHHRRRAL